jgi:cytochrome c oxidase assembly factor CtaG
MYAGLMFVRGAELGELRWSLTPGIVLPLLLSAALYARGTIALRGRGRGLVLRQWEALTFVGGCLVVALALLSPLHDVSEQLFSAHMVQHELLMTVAAPLLVLGRPMVAMLWGLPAGQRHDIAGFCRLRIVRTVWCAIARPFPAWLIHGLAIWLWHLPSLFEAALRSETVHAVQHACFVGSALLFWWSIIHGQRRAARGTAVVYLFATAVHTGVLGALMTFSRTAWYPAYANNAVAWGLTPISDQQLAGLIMWIPASIAYLIAALVIMRRWLDDSEWTVVGRERAAAAVR